MVTEQTSAKDHILDCGERLVASKGFVGVGLAALPFDLILAFIYRPTVLAPDELHNRETEAQDRTNELIEITVLLKRERVAYVGGKATRAEKRQRLVSDRLEINRLTQMVFMLERDAEELRACKHVHEGYNPLVPFGQLAAGIFLACVSVLWVLQIILYMLVSPPTVPLLNFFLLQFDSWFPMFGNIFYALFSLYLLFCTIKGCFKVGMRFICIQIHPMEVGGTYTNAFLFNLGLILFCTVPVIQFCTYAFSGYAVGTDAFFLFGVQIYFLHFYTLFYANNIFTWIILISAVSTLLYLLYRPRDTSSSTEEFKEKLHRRGASSYAGITTVSDPSSTDAGGGGVKL